MRVPTEAEIESVEALLRNGKPSSARSGNRRTAKESTTPDGLKLLRACDVHAEPVRWLWRDRIALGALTLLVGVPGLGKTLLAIWLAARVSRGDLPGDLSEPAHVFIASAEDSREHTLVPRLEAAGADLSRVQFLVMQKDGFDVGLTLPENVGELDLHVAGQSARLVIVDPIMAHLATGLDSHRDHSVRRALAPLHRLATDHGCSVLAIGHLNKAPSGDIFSRVGGSVGLTAAARSILLATPDPDAPGNDSKRVVSHAKSNLGRLAPALRIEVESRAVRSSEGPEIPTAVAVPGEEAPHIRVADLLRPPEEWRPAKRGG